MIKAIETKHKGYRFRSRLEARWAVFFDTLTIKYEYEKEGFDLEGRWYLPDFWMPLTGGLPGRGFWIEIKPERLDREQIALMALLAKETGHRTFAIQGNPWPGEHIISVFRHHHHGIPHFIPWVEDGTLIEIESNDGYLRSVRVRGSRFLASSHFVTSYEYMCKSTPNLMEAFEAARSARFEHGEQR